MDATTRILVAVASLDLAITTLGPMILRALTATLLGAGLLMLIIKTKQGGN